MVASKPSARLGTVTEVIVLYRNKMSPVPSSRTALKFKCAPESEVKLASFQVTIHFRDGVVPVDATQIPVERVLKSSQNGNTAAAVAPAGKQTFAPVAA